MSDREEKFKKEVQEIFPGHIIIDDKRYQLSVHMLAVGAHCIDYAEIDRQGAFDWKHPLVRTQCKTASECINRAWKLLKTAIEKDTKDRMTKKILRKLTSEEYEWIKEHVLSNTKASE